LVFGTPETFAHDSLGRDTFERTAAPSSSISPASLRAITASVKGIEMAQDQHNYVTRRKMWLLTAEALAFFVLLVFLFGGALYLTFVAP
jgi:hypothetical protein